MVTTWLFPEIKSSLSYLCICIFEQCVLCPCPWFSRTCVGLPSSASPPGFLSAGARWLGAVGHPEAGWGSCRPAASGTPPQEARTNDVPTCCQEHLWSNAHLPGCVTPVASVAEHRCPERWSRSKLPRSASMQSPSCYPFRFTGANIFTVKRYPIILSVCISLITCENMHLFRGPLELWGFLSA